MSMKEKTLFFEALLLLYFIKIKLFFIPFKSLAQNYSTHDFKNKDLLSIQDLRKAIFRANKFAFWKNECLVLSLTSQKMLAKRKIESTLHLGALKGNKQELKAHAWLTYKDEFENVIEFVKKDENYIHLYSN